MRAMSASLAPGARPAPDVRGRRAALALVALAACGEPAPEVRLRPIERPCGKVTSPRALLVTPLGALAADRQLVEPGGPVTLAALPAGTRQLAVEVVGEGGVVAAIGKTAPFELAGLTDGDILPIAMGPPDGACPAGALVEARDRPVVAQAGDGVLVVGGTGATPSGTAELYDPATETSRAVPVPPALVAGALGLAGAALAPLGDGRVALVGGPQPGLAIYEPARGGFAPPVLTGRVRAHHAALALDATHVLVVGGCSALVAGGGCAPGSAELGTFIVDVVAGSVAAGPNLLEPRLDPTLVVEPGRDGRRRLVVIGGRDPGGLPVTRGQRLDPVSGSVDRIDGLGAGAAALDSGAILTAFAPDGATASDGAAVVVPGLTAARPLVGAPARAGATLVGLEDGEVLAVGGGPPVRFQPATLSWRGVPAAELELDGGAAATLLADGTALVLGGRRGGVATAAVARVRPRLLGPYTSAQSVVPADAGSEPALTPLDPARTTTGPRWQLTAGAWAIVGGMRGRELRLEWTGELPVDGASLLVGFVDAGHHHAARLVPGQAAVVEQIDGGEARVLCQGAVVPAAGPVVARAELVAGAVQVRVAGRELVRCPLPALVDGRVGVAAAGASPLAIDSLAVTR